MTEVQNDSPIIRFKNVTKLYKTVIGVNDLNLDLYPGVYGLLGPNGSGKTTLINLVIGQLRPTIGSVSVFGLNPWKSSELLRRVGLCPAADVLYPTVSALDWVTYLVEQHGFKHADARGRAVDALEKTGMAHAMERPMGGYSLGMRQRSKLAQAIAHDPQLLILDEPFNGLDPIGRHEMTELIRDWIGRGRSIILASHVLHEVESIRPSFLLVSGGRLLASGEMNEVRELISDVPNELLIRVNDRRQLAKELSTCDFIDSLRMDSLSKDGLLVETRAGLELTAKLQELAKEEAIEVREIRSEEGSLNQLFATLMKIHRGEI